MTMLWVQHNHSFQSSKEKATNPGSEGKLRENRKKDSKALVIIQQAVHNSVFSQLAAATTSKQAWLILQKAFQGDSRVLVVKLQSLIRDFETLMMKNEESIADFLSRATTIISPMQTYGETIKDQNIVEKAEEEEDIVVEVVIPKKDCWYKNQRANFAAENEASDNNGKGENKLFMTNIPSDQKTAEAWFIDSGCSNHMTGLKSVFKELNEGEKLNVELENGKELQVEGKGTVGIETHHGNRILTNVHFGESKDDPKQNVSAGSFKGGKFCSYCNKYNKEQLGFMAFKDVYVENKLENLFLLGKLGEPPSVSC
ncbi:Retrovirus-related Pol polyprotein from transposon TNT 1-94 [Cucumis melo var. makuwa]|uniref:Retrovirus-related Pol polyprotein from transposon TNT 1-94 n=1 Tax=Cucumis melo var. makuwa TaxID=1194695 RepID=A0A5D3CQH2_CUCMM|nr:Retrovirus-related Pol polyprotein from transposon TNT 1-94 [Cucumis melo var. makuwa]